MKNSIAVNIALMANPASSMLTIGVLPPTLARLYTRRTAPNAPKKAAMDTSPKLRKQVQRNIPKKRWTSYSKTGRIL